MKVYKNANHLRRVPPYDILRVTAASYANFVRGGGWVIRHPPTLGGSLLMTLNAPQNAGSYYFDA